MARKPTVLTPRPPRKTKAKAEPEVAVDWSPRPGMRYRVRPLGAEPKSWPVPALYTDDEFDAELHADDLRERGIGCVIEVAMRAGYAPRANPPVLVAQLVLEHQAKARTLMIPRASGELREDTRFEISPEGQRRIYEAMEVPGG